MSKKTPMRKTKKKKDADGQVEKLLKSVEDDMLLSLSLHSHLSVSPLATVTLITIVVSEPSNPRRPLLPLQPLLLLLPQLLPSIHTLSISAEASANPKLTAALRNNLATRFAAFKSSLSLPQSIGVMVSKGDYRDEEDVDEDDEVERLIQWVKDAAHLDPSPPSDDGDDVDDDDNHNDNEEGDDRCNTK